MDDTLCQILKTEQLQRADLVKDVQQIIGEMTDVKEAAEQVVDRLFFTSRKTEEQITYLYEHDPMVQQLVHRVVAESLKKISKVKWVDMEFVHLMDAMLTTNDTRKGNWSFYQPERYEVRSEIEYHSTKLQASINVTDQGGTPALPITEAAANLANYCMKAYEMERGRFHNEKLGEPYDT